MGEPGSQVQGGTAQNQGSDGAEGVEIILEPDGHPFTNGCFNWMIPNHYTKSACFTKHPFEFWLFRVPKDIGYEFQISTSGGHYSWIA